MHKDYNYSPYFYSPASLANKVISLYFQDGIPSFPIDTFRILRDFDIILEPRDFEKLEGIYIAPENEDDIALIAINKKRPVTRQRYTAAHELCHHIKDRTNNEVYCPIGSKDSIERFANDFASELLMPMKYFREQAEKYAKDGYVSFDDAIFISEYFGTSFSSCIFRLAYRLNMIEGDIDAKKLKKRIDKFKPNTKRVELGLPEHDISLLRNTINSYSYIMPVHNDANWHRFKNDFVYNENRLEGLEIVKEQVAEIVTDLRINKQDSVFCNDINSNIIQVVGHSSVYQFILETTENPSGYSIKDLHRILFQYSPHPEAGGEYRQSNNKVTGACIETTNYTKIPEEIYFLNKDIEYLLVRKDVLSYTEYIDEAVKIHHRLTQIHPFCDGNGRISRAMLNWLFSKKQLVPVYLKAAEKHEYYDALEDADKGNYDKLYVVFYRAVINSLVQLNDLYLL